MPLEKAQYDSFKARFAASFEETNNTLFLSIVLVVTSIFIAVFESTGSDLSIFSSNTPTVAAGLYMVAVNTALKLPATHYPHLLFQLFFDSFLQVLKYQELVILLYFAIFC